MPDAPETTQAEPLRDEVTRPQALALFWSRCAAIARQIAEVRQLRAEINRRWGRAPRLPRWDRGES